MSMTHKIEMQVEKKKWLAECERVKVETLHGKQNPGSLHFSAPACLMWQFHLPDSRSQNYSSTSHYNVSQAGKTKKREKGKIYLYAIWVATLQRAFLYIYITSTRKPSTIQPWKHDCLAGTIIPYYIRV